MKLIHCDFCYVQIREELAWSRIYAPRTIPSKYGVMGKDDNGEWAACEDCNSLILAKDVEGLLRRSQVLDPAAAKVKAAENWKRWLFDQIVNDWELLVPIFRGRPPQFTVRDAQHRDGGIG